MSMSKLFKRFALAVTLLTGTGLAPAEETDVCSPFRDGKVDESVLATMLSAADDGHLFRIQQESSQVGFCVDSKLSRIEGVFRDFKGGMALDTEENGTGQTMILIKASSLDTEGNIVEKMIKGENFFDVEHYPRGPVRQQRIPLDGTGYGSAEGRTNIARHYETRHLQCNADVT